jgi:hypothetical protein
LSTELFFFNKGDFLFLFNSFANSPEAFSDIKHFSRDRSYLLGIYRLICLIYRGAINILTEGLDDTFPGKAFVTGEETEQEFLKNTFLKSEVYSRY